MNFRDHCPSCGYDWNFPTNRARADCDADVGTLSLAALAYTLPNFHERKFHYVRQKSASQVIRRESRLGAICSGDQAVRAD
jgi:hypothetical protein